MDYLFQFEQDKYYALRRIPMAMRIKLDLCGIKLSLRDWSKFSRSDRETLAALPYATEAQLAAFRARVEQLVAMIDGDSTTTEPCVRPTPWELKDEVPGSVRRQLDALGVPAPTVEQWSSLSDLQRYALIKLTREGGKNEKLPAALNEFCLLPAGRAA